VQTITNKSRYSVAAQTAAGVVVVRPGKSAETKYEVLNAEELAKVKGVKVSGEAEKPKEQEPAPTQTPAGATQKAPATPTAPSAPKAPTA